MREDKRIGARTIGTTLKIGTNWGVIFGTPVAVGFLGINPLTSTGAIIVFATVIVLTTATDIVIPCFIC